jgi:hypothetical protein
MHDFLILRRFVKISGPGSLTNPVIAILSPVLHPSVSRRIKVY